jgi:alkylhydroperoxidase/carboxymuconolactone decarboxylase family protein YurZ
MKILIVAIFLFSNIINTQALTGYDQSLSEKQKSIIVISAHTAKGDLANLKTELNEGLDAGLTINQIKEVLVHLYAYCGFPLSIRGLQTFMEVLDERKPKESMINRC